MNEKKIALLSVYDKSGIVEFAQALVGLGWEILASGGTARTLKTAGISVRDVAELVGGEAILGHRVVTISREIAAGLLATESDQAELDALGIPPIGLVCVDMYPIYEAIAAPDATWDSVIEKTDIGGPLLLRMGAKGKRIAICDPDDRPRAIQWLQDGMPNRDTVVRSLAAKAEGMVAEYVFESAVFLSERKFTIASDKGWGYEFVGINGDPFIEKTAI